MLSSQLVMRPQPKSNPSLSPSPSCSLSHRPTITLNLRLSANLSLNRMITLEPRFFPQMHLMLCYSLNSTVCRKLPV